MVHLRLNTREINPNKHINFISALPAPDAPAPYTDEDARQLLRALAAQVRPLMKAHGFEVNSFEEYEYNRVFAGRNWNNGETIELVLRHADGTFMSSPWLLGTLCHELAHIKHMNHGRDFQRLWDRLRDEVSALQARGYYGDGYWSSGSRLADSSRVGGQVTADYDLPEYICGGAQSKSRPKSYSRRRVQRRVAGPSRHTGAQTERKRKPGARVTAKGKFKGDGVALNSGISDEEQKKKGTGFRKQAGSKRAREERALAAEKRLRSLQGSNKTEKEVKSEDSGTEEDPDYEQDAWKSLETDEMRRQTMKELEGENEGEYNSSQHFMKNFLRKSSKTKNEEHESTVYSSLFNAIEISDDDDETACNLPSTSNPVIEKPTRKPLPADKTDTAFSASQSRSGLSSSSSSSQTTSKSLGLGRLVQEEMTLRRRESLGLVGSRKLGSASGGQKKQATKTSSPVQQDNTSSRSQASAPWACLVCTFENQPAHLACSVCATPRGEQSWTGQNV